MARKQGDKTLDLSADDNNELLALCADNNNAEKKWLGGVCLRYGMSQSAAALAWQGAESAMRTRKRREARQPATTPDPQDGADPG